MDDDGRYGLTFDEMAASLEEVVHELERAELSSGISMNLFEQGFELCRDLSERLEETHQSLRDLMAEDDVDVDIS